MKKNISFLHIADLHLDSPFKGLASVPEDMFEEIRNSTFQSFQRIIDTAIQKQVDFILLVGDLFENEKQSLKAQVFLRECFETLETAGIDVFLSYGNHDYKNGNAYRLSFPDNVHIFQNEKVQAMPYIKNGERLAHIYGFSYEDRAILENKAEDYQIEDKHIPFHIAMLHGSLHGVQGHDPYAPFTLRNLTEKPFDYWALGHIHQRQVLHEDPPVIYPGNIQGRHRNEAGAKGCYHVEMTETSVETTFIETASLQFAQERIKLEADTTIDSLQAQIEQVLEQYTDGAKLMALSVETKMDEDNGRLDNLIHEVVEMWNAKQEVEENFVYVYQVKISYNTIEKLPISEALVEEIGQALADEAMLKENIAIVTSNRQLSRYIESIEGRSIQKEAKQKLQALLWSGGMQR